MTLPSPPSFPLLAPRLARSASWGMLVVSAVAALLAPLLMALAHRQHGLPLYSYWLADALLSLGFPLIGSLLLAHHRAPRLGWLFLLSGFSLAVGNLCAQYAQYAWHLPEAGLADSAVIAAWWGGILGQFGFVMLPLVFLHFPNGRLPSPRWR